MPTPTTQTSTPSLHPEIMKNANGAFHGEEAATAEPILPVAKNIQDKWGEIETKALDIAGTASDYVKKGQDFVRENPRALIATVATLGFLVGGFVLLTLWRKRPQSNY